MMLKDVTSTQQRTRDSRCDKACTCEAGTRLLQDGGSSKNQKVLTVHNIDYHRGRFEQQPAQPASKKPDASMDRYLCR